MIPEALAAIDPRDVESLTRRLIAIPSVSPDPEGEARCGETLAAHLPADILHGIWSTRDGRPVVWAMVRGRSPRTVVLLGHYDTVGVGEYTTLGAGDGAGIAFDPVRLRDRLHHLRAHGFALPGDVVEDLDQESRSPGTWMFGRGALDMKSGLAAGMCALESLSRARLDGNVLWVSTPDEEHASAGMAVAAQELVRLREGRGLDYVGVLNLDYGAEPCGFHGLMGKRAVGVLVLGVPAHAGSPAEGVDAAQLAATIALGATTTPLGALADPGERPPLPSLIQLRDLKRAYDAQTAAEAIVELNVISAEVESARILRVVQGSVTAAIETWANTVRAAGGRTPLVHVHALAEVEAPFPPSTEQDSLLGARARTLEILSRRTAHLVRPAVVLFLFPPYYPPAPPRDSALARAAFKILEHVGLPMRGRYPYISDASYVAWRGEPVEEIARHLPVLGGSYRLPHAAAAALDLDVVNVGPWGRGAHGLYERVNAPFAFGRLPGLIAAIAAEACRDR